MTEYYVRRNNEAGYWELFEAQQLGRGHDRLIASHIPTAMWAEAMVEWANSLEAQPALAGKEQ